MIFPPKSATARKEYECTCSAILKKEMESGRTRGWDPHDLELLYQIQQDDWKIVPGTKYIRYTRMTPNRAFDADTKAREDAYTLCEQKNIQPNWRWKIVYP